MLRAEVPLEDGQRLAVQRLGLGVLALPVEQRRKGRHIRRDLGMVRAELRWRMATEPRANGSPRA